ncbi:MAG: SDR family oxidoreductase [Chloroflexi bacterium]|nr:SDR family oxidoreductase [Chloroflexota bacterium]OJW02823.1 MAG: hypothetical protein BGO39_06255 [Chloroflexi bacterium 54-19]
MPGQDLFLVVGASGQTGRRVVKSLLAKGLGVRAFVRSQAKVVELQDYLGLDEIPADNLEFVVGDPLDQPQLLGATVGVKAVLTNLGGGINTTTEEREAIEHYYLVKLTQAAAQNGVGQVVLCSSMGTETPAAIPRLAKILEAKRRGEIILEKSGLDYTIVRPGGLHNNPGGEPVSLARHLPGFGAISRDDVAEVMVQAVLQPAARNRIVEIINDGSGLKASSPDLFSQPL